MTGVLAWVLCLAFAPPAALLALECLVGARRPDEARRPAGSAPPFVVVMPAHQEAGQIGASVAATMAQLRPCDALLVVADNCTDETAAIARAAGALVVERHDPALRGKGYALEFAREALVADPALRKAELILVVDADCRPGGGALERLAGAAARSGGGSGAGSGPAAVQGAYLLECPPDASPIVRVSCFAFLVKNLVRQLALCRLAGVALLQGSGMAFPRAVFLRARWPVHSLVEDLELGLNLLIAGGDVVFEPSARFYSAPSSASGTAGQRRRWEHGMLQVMGRFVPRLLRAGLAGPRRLLVVALDLMVPPTVLLATLGALATGLAWALAWGSPAAFVLLAANGALALAMGAAWFVHGRAILPPASVWAAMRYVVWKLPILVQFVTRRERQWIRTERGS